MTGKLVVATEPDELPRIAELVRRGGRTASSASELDAAGMREHEPQVRGIAALHVPSTGVCDFRAIAGSSARLVRRTAARSICGRAVRASCGAAPTSWSARTGATCSAPRSWSARGCTATSWPGRRVPTPACGSCRSAASTPSSASPPPAWSSGLVYPVPDPAFPFLGVHATRGDRRQRARRAERRARAGPRGVRLAAVRPQELGGTLAYPGLLRLARRHWRYGLGEMHRSLSRAAMAASPADAARRPGRGPAPGRRRGARAGGRAGRHAGRRLPVRAGGRAPERCCTCSTRPRPRRPPRCRSAGRSSSRSPARGWGRCDVPRGRRAFRVRASPASSAGRTRASRR